MLHWIFIGNRRAQKRRTRSRGALAGSPPGAGGRLLDLTNPMPPR